MKQTGTDHVVGRRSTSLIPALSHPYKEYLSFSSLALGVPLSLTPNNCCQLINHAILPLDRGFPCCFLSLVILILSLFNHDLPKEANGVRQDSDTFSLDHSIQRHQVRIHPFLISSASSSLWSIAFEPYLSISDSEGRGK